MNLSFVKKITLKKVSLLLFSLLILLFFAKYYEGFSYTIRNYLIEKKTIKLLTKLNSDNAVFRDKIIIFGRSFVGLPYKLDRPQDRSYFFASSDCVSFVRNVLTLSISESISDFKRKILELNYYNQSTKLENIKHFTLIDYIQGSEWSKYNLRLTDITDKIVNKKKLQKHAVEVDRSVFIKNVFKIENEWTKSLPVVKVELSYFKPDAFSAEEVENLKKFNKKGIFIFVNIPTEQYNSAIASKIKTNLDINHLGFLFFDENDNLKAMHSSVNYGIAKEMLFVENYLTEDFKKTKGFSLFYVDNLR